jgi:hypothetical protein
MLWGAVAPRLWESVRDLLPIIAVISFFQLAVLKTPFPELADVLVGGVMVILGLMLFVQGLQMGLFPIGDAMAVALARKGSVTWLLVFSFALGFSTTIAEPALIAITGKAAEVAAAAGMIGTGAGDTVAMDAYALGLRLTVAFSVGLAICIGVIRILRGWPIHYLVIGGYLLVIAVTPLVPEEIIGVAFDSGGVTTSTVTVPLVTALGVGLASVIKGRNPLVDGFGLIAFASLLPMLFVMGFGLIYL